MKKQIGQWSRQEFINALKEFSEIYINKPIDSNHGGMTSIHGFYAWFMTKQLQPKVIIESGVYFGQGTYFLAAAAPQAKFICIDPIQDQISVIHPNAYYTENDISTIDWKKTLEDGNVNPEDVLIFFDDHQDAMERLRWMVQESLFKYAIFEDNYSNGHGDCNSLKKVLEAGQEEDIEFIRNNVRVYFECPPIFSSSKTRWNTDWSHYNTKDPLLTEVTEEYMKIFQHEHQDYTWIAGVQLK